MFEETLLQVYVVQLKCAFFPVFLSRRSQMNHPPSLVNQGSTCYLNSLLQAWIASSKWRECVKRLLHSANQVKHPLIYELHKFVMACEEDNHPKIRHHHERFVAAFFRRFPDFATGTQEDVDEVRVRLEDVFERFDAETNQMGRLSPAKVAARHQKFEDAFHASIKSFLRCVTHGLAIQHTACSTPGCDYVGLELTPENVVQLSLPDGSNSPVELQELLQRHAQGAMVTRNCERCHATGREDLCLTRLWRAPALLWVVLKRFNNVNGRLIKNNTRVILQEEVRLFPFTFEATIYRLRSVVEHMGSLNAGHYTARVRYDDPSGQGSQWFEANDEIIRLANGDFMASERPYLMLFERVRTATPSPSARVSNLQ